MRLQGLDAPSSSSRSHSETEINLRTLRTCPDGRMPLTTLPDRVNQLSGIDSILFPWQSISRRFDNRPTVEGRPLIPLLCNLNFSNTLESADACRGAHDFVLRQRHPPSTAFSTLVLGETASITFPRAESQQDRVAILQPGSSERALSTSGSFRMFFPARFNRSNVSSCQNLLYEARCEQGSRSRAEATVVECSLLLSLLAARRLVFVAPARPASLCPVTPVRQTSLSADSGTANRCTTKRLV